MIAILFFCVIRFSCHEAQESEEGSLVTKDTVAGDITILVKDSSITLNNSDSLSLGAYQGIFPCPDCDGIQQTILFTKEKVFKQEQMVWGKNEILKSSEGNWEMKNDTIKLIQNNEISQYSKRNTTSETGTGIF